MKELDAIYRKHKRKILPLVFGFVSVFVFFRVIIPQWSDISDVQSLLTTKDKVVKAKEATVDLLNSISQDQIESDYALATTALPIQKDIVLIFSELSDVASKSNVKLGGFTLKVGGIYSVSKTTKTAEKAINGIPYLNILVNVSGQNNGLRKFAELMYKSIPIVEIKNIDISKNDARYDVNFYFKPVALKAPDADSTALTSLNTLETSQLKELKSWSSTTSSQ